jgi:hypothetical protein
MIPPYYIYMPNVMDILHYQFVVGEPMDIVLLIVESPILADFIDMPNAMDSFHPYHITEELKDCH